ncbi:MAG: PQQ-binding-like beta-propeller repeat protein [Planctomycetota bacterium]
MFDPSTTFRFAPTLGALLAAALPTVSLVAATPQDAAASDACPGDRWPGFRGNGTSVTQAVDLPMRWSDDEGVTWSVSLPGYGQSSPVVHGERVIVTSVEGPNKERCQVSCYRLGDGQLLWSRSYPASVEITSSKMVSRGAPTPVVDDQRVYAWFESGDLIALDHQGETLWRRSLVADFGGGYKGNHGFGGSLLAVDDGVVLLLDHDGPSFLARFAGDSGETLWQTERTSRISWSTPVLDAARGEVVVSSGGTVDGYALADGAQRWSVDNVQGNTVPSATVAGDLIVVGASKGDNLALRRTDSGCEVVWRAEDARPSGFGSPLVIGDAVLVVNKAGAVYAVDRATGALRFQQRIAQSCWASPVATAAGDRIYFFGKDGTTTVARAHADRLEVLAENERPTEDTVYGVAVVDRAILLREGRRLSCIGAAPAADAPADAPADESGAKGGG